MSSSGEESQQHSLSSTLDRFPEGRAIGGFLDDEGCTHPALCFVFAGCVLNFHLVGVAVIADVELLP